MRVLQIIDSLAIGGAEKLVVDTVPLLVEKGFIVDVLLLNGDNTPFYEELKNKGCTNIYSLGRSYYNLFYIIRIIPYLRNYDVVHAHLFPVQYFVVLAKVLSFSSTFLLFTEHNTENRRLNNPVFKKLEQWIYSYYNKVICITNEVRNALLDKLDLSIDKLLVINNGVNLVRINATLAYSRSDFGFSKADRLLVMVAGFREQKDQDTVIRTLAMLPDCYKLILVGDGVRKVELLKLIRENNLVNRVTLLGVRSDVYSIIKMCDVAVLSSHWEGFGLAAIEAMACGIPTIASNVPGLAQVVEGGGLLFEKGNFEDLKRKLLSLEDNFLYSEIRLNGISKAKEYSLELMVNKMVSVYNEN